MAETKKQRHPFRFVMRALLVLGVIAAVTKFVSERSRDFSGLTESEARAKFEDKLGPRIGPEKASAVADQVIPRLKEKGIIRSDLEAAAGGMADAISDAGDTVVDLTDEAATEAEEAAEKIEEKID